MEEEKKYLLIEDYLSGKLLGNDKDIIDQKLNEDPSFANEVQLHKELSETFENDNLNHFRRTLSEINNDSKQTKAKIFSIRQRNALLALAATIALFFGSQMFFGSKVSSSELFSQNFETYPLAFNHRSNGDTESLLNKAINAYNEEDFKTAVPIFDALFKSNPSNKAFQFYKAMALLSNEQAEEAKPIFIDVIKSKSPLFIEQAQWYLALTYLKLDEGENAKNTLNHLSKDHYQYNLAQDILKQL